MEDPRSALAPLLPLLTLLRQNGTVTPTEQALVQAILDRSELLGTADRNALAAMLAPDDALPMEDLLRWRKSVRTVARDLPEGTNLAGLGVAMGRAHGMPPEQEQTWRDVLAQLEIALGILGTEAVHHYRDRPGTHTEANITQPSFDHRAMARILDGDEAAMKERVFKVLADPRFQYPADPTVEEHRRLVTDWCQQLANAGLGSVGMPKTYGGGDDPAGYFTVMETLSYHDLSLVIKFGVQFGLWGMSIQLLGTEKHHKRYLRDIGTLALPGCFAMTETGHGSDVQGIRTTATYDHASRSFSIHTPEASARKEYIGNAAVDGRAATVFAKLIIDGVDHGVSAFVVPLRDVDHRVLPGITIGDCGPKMGLNGVDNGTIEFDQFQVPYDALLDRFAQVDAEGRFQSPIAGEGRRFFTMLGTLVGGRIGIPRSALSAAKSGLTIAIRYGDRRRQFGPEGGSEVPILNYRMHQRRLMPLLADAYAMHFALRHLTTRYLGHAEENTREIEALAAGLKAYGTWRTTGTLQECRECCGGKGYLSENRIGGLKNDTDVYTTFEGDNTVLMQLVARSRLTAFRKDLGDMGLFGLLGMVSEQARITIKEKNPVITRSTDRSHLMAPDFHLNAFRYRASTLLTGVARRLKRHIDTGMDAFDAANVTQYHMVTMAEAYIEQVLLEQFQQAVESTSPAECQTALRKLCQLFALKRIEDHSAWYQEQGYLEGVKSKAVRKEVDQLCWEIRHDAPALVDAFGIPDELLGAAILRT